MNTVSIQTEIEAFDGLKNQSEPIDYFRTMNRSKPQKYFIETWGCQMNEHDSEKLAGILEVMGFKPTDTKNNADVIIFNTCAVRENAELKVYGNLGHLKNLKRKNKHLKIVVCGCMMQQDHVVEELKAKYDHVDLIFGTHNTHEFPKLLQSVYETSTMQIDIWEHEGQIIEDIPANRDYNVKAFVNIMYGCNNFCSYCIVPHTRGRERSRTPEDILNEIQDLVNNGVKEVTLLGQNVNSYGNYEDFNCDFTALLKRVNAIDGLQRIRFMTSHPKDISYELIDQIKRLDKVCEFLHLPIQAAGNDLLKKMNRKYTKEYYLDLVNYAKEQIDDIALSTDIIVGFPGETEEDIDELIELLKDVRYDNVFSFIYSPRKGTPAYNFENEIPEDVKSQRFQRVLAVINDIVRENNKKYQDQVVEVLVEGTSKNDDDVLTGKSRLFKTVNFKGDKELIGSIVQVKITEPKSFSLYGEIVE